MVARKVIAEVGKTLAAVEGILPGGNIDGANDEEKFGI